MTSIKSLFQQPQTIAYCLGASNYTWVHLQDGNKELVAKSISVLATQLPGFIRVHKRVLVNPGCIKRVHQLPRKKGAGEIHLASGEVFPVSRRRWADLDPYLRPRLAETDAASGVAIPQVSPSEPPVPAAETFAPLLLLVTDDAQKTDRAQQLIHQQWAGYRLQIISPRLLVVTLRSARLPSVYPTLILLDAQTQSVECMNTLRLVKQTDQWRHIPVIVFVPPTDRFVVEGYQYQANSVVAIPNNSLVFEQHLARILHFWLAFVALPSAPVN